MADLGRSFRALERAVPEGIGEIAVSLAIVAAVVAVRRLARRSRPSSGGSSSLRVGVSAAVTLVTGAGVVALVGVWGLLEPLVAALGELGLGRLGGELALSAVLLGTAYTLTSFLGGVIEEIAEAQGGISEHQREVLYRLTQVGLYALVGLTIVTLFTNDPGSLLVGAGFLGIVVGIAARQTLGSVLAGFVLMFSRPFEINDWVEIGDREGIVTKITIAHTQLQTFSGEHVMLPNDDVSSRAIVNRTRKGRLRVEVEVGVDYGADPRRAAAVAKEAVEGLDETLDVPAPQVVVKRFADSAVVLGVRGWIGSPSSRRRWRARTAIVATVKEAFVEEGIEIPFPQRTVSQRERADVGERFAVGERSGRGGAKASEAEGNEAKASEGSDGETES